MVASQSIDEMNGELPANSGYFFLSARARYALPRYQYTGEDKSLLYIFVLSPLASLLVNRCTPRSISPNSITSCGLCFMISSYCIFWYYSPDLEPLPLPAWIFGLHSVAMLVYQTLDNMDGKQARRTGSSSPLGLLFDHGCDAVNSIFGSANWILSIGLVVRHDAWMIWAVVIGPMALFYVATWEEYYTGRLILPRVNGPNEGLLLGALTSLTTCFLGVSYWQSSSWFDAIVKPNVQILPSLLQSWIPEKGWRNADLQVMAACAGFVQETLTKIYAVSRGSGVQALASLVPFLLLALLTLIVGLCDANVFRRMPRTSLHLTASLFVEMCTQLMLDHISTEQFRWFRWCLVPLAVLTALVGLGVWEAGPETDEFLLIYTSSLCAFLFTKMTVVISEICALLNIWCFDIVTPRASETAYSSTNGHGKHDLAGMSAWRRKQQ